MLSAAHCGGSFEGNNIYIGGRSRFGFDALDTVLAVRELIHPDFNNFDLDNDFMLVRMYTAHVSSIGTSLISCCYIFCQIKLERKPIATSLATWNEDPAVPVDGETVSLIGYGITDTVTGDVSNVLLEVQLPMINQEVCKDIFLGLNKPALFGRHNFLISTQSLTTK